MDTMFMNIPAALIVLFQLALTLFPFGFLICFSSLFLSRRSFSCLRTPSPLPRSVVGGFGGGSAPRSYLNPASLLHRFKKDARLTANVCSQIILLYSFCSFSPFLNPSSAKLDPPLRASWHPSSDKITRRTPPPTPPSPGVSVFQSFKQRCTRVEAAVKVKHVRPCVHPS